MPTHVRRTLQIEMKGNITICGERSFLSSNKIVIPLDSLIALNEKTFFMIQGSSRKELMEEATEVARARASHHGVTIKEESGKFEMVNQIPSIVFNLAS